MCMIISTTHSQSVNWRVLEHVCGSTSKIVDFGLGPYKTKYDSKRGRSILRPKIQSYNFALGGDGKMSIAFSMPMISICLNKGYSVLPCMIDNPRNQFLLINKKPFGLVVPIQSWVDDEEILERAYGMGTGRDACVFCKDQGKAELVAGRSKAAMVLVNSTQILSSTYKERGWNVRLLIPYAL